MITPEPEDEAALFADNSRQTQAGAMAPVLESAGGIPWRAAEPAGYAYRTVNEEDGSFSVEGPNLPGFYAALARAQAAFGPVVRSRTVEIQPREGRAYKFSYAELDSVLDAVLPALNAHGFSLLQPWHGMSQQMIRIMLVHEFGVLTAKVQLPPSERDGMQAKGSAITYVRRYLCSLLGVAAEDDDDGNRVDGNTTLASTQKPRSATPASKRREPPAPAPAVTGVADPMRDDTGRAIGAAMRALGFNRKDGEDLCYRVLSKSAFDAEGRNTLSETEAQKLLSALSDAATDDSEARNGN